VLLSLQYFIAYGEFAVGDKVLVCRACSKSNGCVRITHKSPGSPDDGNPIVEGKGVTSDRESEGSHRQNFDVTNRNRIRGLSFRVTDP